MKRQHQKILPEDTVKKVAEMFSDPTEAEKLLFDIQRLQKELDGIKKQGVRVQNGWDKISRLWGWRKAAVDAFESLNQTSAQLKTLSNTLNYLLDNKTK